MPRTNSVMGNAGALGGIACIPMLAALLSSTDISAWKAAATFTLLFCACVAFIALVATLLSSSSSVVLKFGGRLVSIAFVGAFLPNFLAFLLEQIRSILLALGLLPTYRTAIIFIGSTIILSLLFSIARRLAQIKDVTSYATRAVALLFLVLTLHAAALTLLPRAETSSLKATPPPIHAQNRVVWVILDELDSSQLSKDIDKLPSFKELIRSAIIATNAYPPANFTHQSLPRLLVGRPLMSAEFSQTRVNLRENPSSPWKSLADDPDYLLNQLAKEGYSVAVSGWHLPYCSTLLKEVNCTDDEANELPGHRTSPWGWLYAKNIWAQHFFSYRLKNSRRPQQEIQALGFTDPRLIKVNANRETLEDLVESTQTQIKSGAELVFSHLPCPHLPRMDGQPIEGENALLDAYAANLAICDDVLGKFNSTIRDATRSDPRPITLILTSDHWLRSLDCIEQKKLGCTAQHRRVVPWMLASFKNGQLLERDDSFAVVDHQFNTLGTRKLVIELLKNRPKTSYEIAALISQLPDHPTLIEPY